MKSTGIVRRVDELGRIVIPKEIRRTLRIRNGESLEIFIDKDVINLRKFSEIHDLSDISKEIVELINSVLKKTILITDRDKFVAGSGSLKKIFIDKKISKTLETLIKDRRIILENNRHDIELLENETSYYSYVIYPIIINGDAVGLVIILSDKNDIGILEDNMAYVTAQFLVKYIEE